MSIPEKCVRCGEPIPVTALDGACPHCLVKLAVNFSSTLPSTSNRFQLPSLQELNDRFGELDVVRLLGCGGMGAVYQARQTKLDRMIALKILPLERACDPQFTERFLQEARALAKLNHPHIVAVYDAGQNDNYLYIIMEFVDGTSLRELLRDGRLSASEAMRSVPQICEAMQYAHDHGVIHRDIKPENVLLDQQGHVKIVDFGLAKLSDHYSPQFTLTETGMRMGSAKYMAPEQSVDTANVDHRADIYSMGVMIYEMLTGKLPSLDYTPPSRIAEVDARVDRVVERSIKESPDERYQQAVEVKQDVERIASSRPPKQIISWLSACLLLVGAIGWLKWLNVPEPMKLESNKLRPIIQEAVRAVVPIIPAPFDAITAGAHQKSAAKDLGIPVETENTIGMSLRLIPPGEFELAPGYRVRLTRAYYLSCYEVSVGEFQQFVTATKYKTLAESSGKGGWIHPAANDLRVESQPEFIWNHARFAPGADHPVSMVMPVDANEFCRWLSQKESRTYRLPTEAEWVWANRAGASSDFYFEEFAGGDDFAWHAGNSGNHSHSVGQKRSNAWGLFDMAGNLIELCAGGHTGDFPHGTFQNPFGAPEIDRVVGRGGSFSDPLSVQRFSLSAEMPFFTIGFRVLCEVPADLNVAAATAK